MSPKEVCESTRWKGTCGRGDEGPWGQEASPTVTTLLLNEQNSFKNPYKFFIICYTFRDNIYKREGRKREEIYSKLLHKTWGLREREDSRSGWVKGFTTPRGASLE